MIRRRSVIPDVHPTSRLAIDQTDYVKLEHLWGRQISEGDLSLEAPAFRILYLPNRLGEVWPDYALSR
jgi:hypothetical protein